MHEDEMGAWAWWNQRRLAYNAALVIAGFGAFVAFATIGWTCTIRRDPQFEITAFTILFQSIGYLFAIGLANIAYCAGPIMEKIVRDEWLGTYRRVSFWLGFWFSVALPFSVPLLHGYLCIFPMEP